MHGVDGPQAVGRPDSTARARQRSSTGMTTNASQSSRADHGARPGSARPPPVQGEQHLGAAPGRRTRRGQRPSPRAPAPRLARARTAGARPMCLRHRAVLRRQAPRGSSSTRPGRASTGDHRDGARGPVAPAGGTTSRAMRSSSVGPGAVGRSRGPSWAAGAPSTVTAVHSPAPARRTTAATSARGSPDADPFHGRQTLPRPRRRVYAGGHRSSRQRCRAHACMRQSRRPGGCRRDGVDFAFLEEQPTSFAAWPGRSRVKVVPRPRCVG